MRNLKIGVIFFSISIILSLIIFFAKNNSVETDKNELVTFNCITDDETDLAAFLDRKKHELILYDDIYQFIKIKEENDDEVLLFENKKNETTSIASINISMMPDTTKPEKQILNYHCKISHKIK